MSTFDKIDNYFKDKKGNEVSLVFFMLFALIGTISYLYIFPITETKLSSAQKATQSMNQKLLQEQAYKNSVVINGDKEFFIKKLSKEIEEEKNLLKRTTFENGYVDNKLKELSYLLFNNKNWATFLDSIAFVAKENKIDIKSIENQFTVLDLQKIDKVLNVTIVFSGTFQNVMNFLNTLEENQLVVDIYDMELKSSNMIDGKLNIAVWGMKY